jgi:hypothetical protein
MFCDGDTDSQSYVPEQVPYNGMRLCGIQRCATCKLTVHVCTSGNEDWTSAMAEKMGMTAAESWRPWLVDQVPAGYVTVYENPAGVANFTFVSDGMHWPDGWHAFRPLEYSKPVCGVSTQITVKEAGHMVPQYQPTRAFELFKRFLHDEPF